MIKKLKVYGGAEHPTLPSSPKCWKSANAVKGAAK
jgi:ribosomal protein L13